MPTANGKLDLLLNNGQTVTVGITVSIPDIVLPAMPPAPVVPSTNTNITHTVKATREGLVGGRTASGWIIDASTPFVALPSRSALHKTVKVTNPLNGNSLQATVLDIGPWNIHDDEYVLGTAKPQAESGVDMTGRKTNLAGIDLGEAVWNQLDMKGNTTVTWWFV